MVRFMLIIFLCFTSSTALAEAPESELALNQKDRQLHVATSFAISLTTYSVLTASTSLSRTEKMAAAFLFTLGVGALKEATDKSFSVGDMKANTLGAGAALMIPIVFNF